jgi:hypothetical protein
VHQRRTEHESCSEADAARTNFSLAPPRRRDDGLAANGNGGGRRNRRGRFFIHRRIEQWINLRTNLRPNHHTGSDHHAGIDLARNQHAGIDHDNPGHNHSGSRNRCAHAGYCEPDARNSQPRNSQPWIHHTSVFTDNSNPGDNTNESDPGDHSEQSDSRDDSGHNHSRNQQSWNYQSWHHPSGRQPDFADPGDNESTQQHTANCAAPEHNAWDNATATLAKTRKCIRPAFAGLC